MKVSENVKYRQRFQSFTRDGEMGVNDITLFTLHSVSKGFL
jgi:hypothetical protein